MDQPLFVFYINFKLSYQISLVFIETGILNCSLFYEKPRPMQVQNYYIAGNIFSIH